MATGATMLFTQYVSRSSQTMEVPGTRHSRSGFTRQQLAGSLCCPRSFATHKGINVGYQGRFRVPQTKPGLKPGQKPRSQFTFFGSRYWQAKKALLHSLLSNPCEGRASHHVDVANSVVVVVVLLVGALIFHAGNSAPRRAQGLVKHGQTGFNSGQNSGDQNAA